MTGFDGERELEDFLAKRSPLHQRLADSDASDPPPELDRLVLSQAREAIQSPASPSFYRAPRWALPMGLAATVLLTFVVVMTMGYLEPRREARLERKVTSAPLLAHTDAVAKQAPLRTERFAPPPQPMPPVPAPAPPPPPALASSISEAAASAEAPTAVVSERSRASEPPVPPSAAAVAANEQPSEAAKPIGPRAWLQKIERLRAAGKTDDADRELAAFHRTYPGQAVPAPAQARPPTR